MGIFEKTNVIKIDEEDIKDAKLSSMDFKNGKTRKRAFLNVLGARIAMQLLFSKKIQANNVYSLYTIQNFLEEFDVADVYFQGVKIDVRLVFNRDEIFIPKTHFEYGLVPDLYLVLELNKDFSSAEPLGFFEPKILNTENQNNDFYFHEVDRLTEIGELKNFLKDFRAQEKPEVLESDCKRAEELFLSYVDEEITDSDKRFLFKQLIGSYVLRKKMVEFENFEMISKKVGQNEEILSDGILDIVGAQKLYEDEAPIDDKAEIIGEVLSDLLDETQATQENEIQLDEDFLKEFSASNEEEEEEEKKSDNKLLESGAKVVATGLELGAAVALGSAAAAAAGTALEGELAKGAVEAVSKGIELGADIIGNVALNNTKGEVLDELPVLDFGETVNGINDFEDTKTIRDKDVFDITDFDFDALSEASPITENEIVNIEEEEFSLEQEVQDELEIAEEFSIEEPSFDSFKQNENESPEDIDINDIPFKVISDEQLLTEDSGLVIEEDTMETIIEENNAVLPDEQDFEAVKQSFGELLDEPASFEQFENIQKPLEEIGDTSEANEELKEKTDFSTLDFDGEEIDSESNEFNFDVDNLSLEGLELSEEDQDFLEDALSLTEENNKTPGSNDPYFSMPEETRSEIEYIDVEPYLDEQPEGTEAQEKDPLQVLFKGSEGANTDSAVPNLTEKKIVDLVNVKNKKMIIAASAACVIFAAVVIGHSALQNNSANVNLSTNMASAPATAGQTPDESGANQPAEETTPQATQSGLESLEQQVNQDAAASSPTAQANASRDMGQAVSDVFSSEPVNASISKIAWEVPEDLAYNDGFRTYLQMAGKNLKLNLQNDLLLATEMAYSNKVVVDLVINKDGSLQSDNIVKSSGSKQIDKIVLQSVKDTLKYLKMPSSELSGGSANATLIINF